jgi:hypothetical protein
MTTEALGTSKGEAYRASLRAARHEELVQKNKEIGDIMSRYENRNGMLVLKNSKKK